MVLIKLGEATVIQPTDIRSTETILQSDLDIEDRMRKFAQELKVIAPKAKDFLYFTCVMMHAAEAALLDDKGIIRKSADGNPLIVEWQKIGKDSVKWVCSDKSVMPYKNNNNDIFPESELKVAHKKWIGRPLCLDHQSQSVDKIRGVIVDTIYDDVRKRVIALCALDKKNYPDLARKVSSGYATNVSMGTAVGRAVCTDCGRVARTESDFCDHMRKKSCYGEINLDLSPLELSLVVSGADPGAKVKHIIARDLNVAADNLSNYVEHKVSTGKIDTEELLQIRKDLQELTMKVSKLVEASDDESDAIGPTRSLKEMEEVNTPATDWSPNVPEAIPSYASELQRAILGAQVKIASIQRDYEKLASMITKDSEEKTMGTDKKAYYQGTVEPNAGGTTYPPEPGLEIRMQDKHMHGAGPFPGVGDVEGMYPGISESDEERKRRLLRLAEEEKRRILREAAVAKAKEQLAKQSYFLGTEEPQTYPKDPGNEKGREDDKHMHGAPPFPQVGDVNGLYGDDLATKEKLLRASWKATFRKVSSADGTVNKAASRWDVYADGKLVLSATVDDITRGNAEFMYDNVATKAFGKNILDNIKVRGLNQVSGALTKQAVPGAPPAPAAAPPPGMPAGEPAAPAEAPPAAEEPPAEPASAGDQVTELIGDLKDLGDEIQEKVSDLEDALGPVEGEAPELAGVEPMPEGEMEGAGAGAPPPTVASLQRFRKSLNGMLVEGIKETIGDLKSHAKEIEISRGLYARKYASMSEEQRKYLNTLTADAVKDAKGTLSDSLRLIGAVIKYAHGTDALTKRADDPQEQLEKGETQGAEKMDADDSNDDAVTFEPEMVTGEAPPVQQVGGEVVGPEATITGGEGVGRAALPPGIEESVSGITELLPNVHAPLRGAEGDPLAGLGVYPGEEPQALEADDGAADDVRDAMDATAGLDLTTKEGRAMYRTKLAQEGLNWSDMPGKAHDGSKDVPNIDVKPTAPYSKFHVLQDTHDAVMELAKMPPKVRKQAEEIARLVQEGSLDANEVDELAKHGVDQDAIKYWKQFWAEAKDPESKEFANKLTQEHAQQKQAEELEVHKARVKRAYELAYDMREKGMIESDQVEDQVGEIMKWNDDGFNSIKNIVARQQVIAKKASMPSVGLLHSSDVIMPAGEPQEQGDVDLRGFLEGYFGNRKF